LNALVNDWRFPIGHLLGHYVPSLGVRESGYASDLFFNSNWWPDRPST
jgi:hypothetical protein